MIPEHAGLLARISEWAYQPPEVLRGHLEGATLRDAEFHLASVQFMGATDALTDTEVYILRTHANDVVVAFRGSETGFDGEDGSLRDWIKTDADAVMTPCAWLRQPREKSARIEVHRGFARAWRQVRHGVRVRVEEGLREGRRSGGRIFVTGHSLGGAIGVLAASELGRFFDHPVHLVSFGAPRTGNAAFARMVAKDARLCMIAQRGDPVPFMPPLGPNVDHTAHRFEHPAGVVYIDREFVPRAGLPSVHVATQFTHHGIASYQEAIDAARS